MTTKAEKRHRKGLWSDIVQLLNLFLVWGFIFLASGNLDGSARPVVTPLIIETTSPYDDQWTQFSGHAVKLRQCSFRRVEWYLGSRNEPNVPVPLVMSEPQIRMVGKIPVEEWRAKIAPPDRLLDGTFADVFHQCKFLGFDRPWLTKTHFWN